MMRRTATTHQPSKLSVYHSNRWRRFGNGVPSMVGAAYGGDIAKALAHTDDQVFATLRAWEIQQGRKPNNWRAVALEAALLDAGYDPDDLRGLIDDAQPE